MIFSQQQNEALQNEMKGENDMRRDEDYIQITLLILIRYHDGIAGVCKLFLLLSPFYMSAFAGVCGTKRGIQCLFCLLGY